MNGVIRRVQIGLFNLSGTRINRSKKVCVLTSDLDLGVFVIDERGCPSHYSHAVT